MNKQIEDVIKEVSSQVDGAYTPWNQPVWQDVVFEAITKKDYGPRDLHATWLMDRHRLGWRHGEKFDANKKTDPEFVDYDELPDKKKQTYKDTMKVIHSALQDLPAETIESFRYRMRAMMMSRKDL